MRLERERDIPAFQGKTWRQRLALRQEAYRRDRWIMGLSVLSVFLAWWFFPFSNWLLRHLGSNSSLLLFVAVSLVFMLPFMWLFHAFFITPRIRKALE